MIERLQKLISAAGLCSRRRAEEWIREGKVTVNGDLARLGDSADPEQDEILVNGSPLPAAPVRTTTILLYKPRGYVTTLSDEKGRPTVAQLLPGDLPRLYPVGRLDQFSEGLLLMTNDGALANALTHPGGEVNKTYHLWVSDWQEGALALLRRPIELDGYRIKPPEVRLVWVRQATGNRQQATGDAPACSGEHCSPQEPRSDEATGQGIANRESGTGDAGTGPSTPLRSAQDDRIETMTRGATALLEITIHEGRNRQIRRMARAAGLTPTRLQRVAEGPITLGGLKPGQWRELSETELSKLKMES